MTPYFHHYILKPPDIVEVFTIERSGIRRWDEMALVYDVRVGSDAFLRHYSVLDRWFHINVSLNGAGELVTEPGSGDLSDLEWAFNCDIATPSWGAKGNLFAIDLFLDVLVAPDGRAFRVKDEEEFVQAAAAGRIIQGEAEGAQAGLADLTAILRGPGLIAFLDRVCPFSTFTPATTDTSRFQKYAFTDLLKEERRVFEEQRTLLGFQCQKQRQ